MTRGRRLATGLLFAAPMLVGFSVFVAGPILASAYFSFCEYEIFGSPHWTGLANYKELFGDELFYRSLWNTVYFTVFGVPLGMATALALALLLNLRVRGMAYFRTIFFLPSIVPLVAGSVLWLWLFNPEYGLINQILLGLRDAYNAVASHLGGLLPLIQASPPGWFADPKWAKPGLIIMSAWGSGGSMILYLAALQDVPQQLYEAAEIDGATPWHKLWHVTIPSISPVLFFTFIMGLIGSFQYFTQAWVMGGGTSGPDDCMLFYAFYLYNTAFSYFRLGYASAMAWILFIIIGLVTALVFKTTGRFVHYEGR